MLNVEAVGRPLGPKSRALCLGLGGMNKSVKHTLFARTVELNSPHLFVHDGQT